MTGQSSVQPGPEAGPQPSISVRRAARALALVLGAALLAGTLVPIEGAPTSGDSLCFICGDSGAADFIANIIAFVPLGLALALATGRPFLAAALVMLMSGTIELLQWRIIAGRDASLGDIVANTLGGLIGAAIAANVVTLVFPPSRVARRLVIIWSLAGASVFAATTWLTGPAPVDLRYRAYWMPNSHRVALTGVWLSRASLFGTPLSDGALVEPSDFPPTFAQGELDVTLVIQGAYAGIVPVELFQLGNRLERRLNVVAEEGDLRFQPLVKATRARFWSPSAVVPGVLNDADSAVTSVRLTTHPGGAQAVWSAAGQSGTAAIRYSPLEYWRFLISDSVIPQRFHPFLAFGSAAMFLLPIGYWSRFAGLSWGLGGALVASLTGLLFVPWALGRPVATASDWTAAAVALILGWLLLRMIRLPTSLRI